MTRPAVRLSMALMACLWLPGCLSSNVMQLATSPRYRFARITEITDAAVLGTDVFVQVSVLRPGRIEPETMVLKIDTHEDYWAQSHSVPPASYMDGIMLAHVPSVALLAPGAIPIDATLLPIEPIEISRMADLKPGGKVRFEGIRVLEVHYRPVDNDVPVFPDYSRGVPLPGDPILAIIGPIVRQEPHPIVISDIQDGHTTRRPWLLLMPLAAAGDAAMLPLQFFGALIAAV